MTCEDDILAELKSINAKLTAVMVYMHQAEREVPEYLRRMSMYYNDLFHSKILWESHGQQMPQFLKDEVDRVHHRLEECILEETSQGGKFYEHKRRFEREGKTFAKRRAVP